MTRRNRRKTQREAAWERRQRDPEFDGEEEDTVFQPTGPVLDPPTPPPISPPDSPNTSTEVQYEVVLDMVQKINNELGLINLDNDKIRSVCEKLLQDNQGRDRAIGDLTGLVKKSLDLPVEHHHQQDVFTPHPIIRH